MTSQKKNINVCTWNLCLGLQYKLNYVREILVKDDVDILCLQETEIKEGLDMNVLKINDYELETNLADNTIKTAVYIKNTLNYERMMNRGLNQNIIVLKIIQKTCQIYSSQPSTDRGRTLKICLKKMPSRIKLTR